MQFARNARSVQGAIPFGVSRQTWKHTAAINTSVEHFWEGLFKAAKPLLRGQECAVLPDNCNTQVHVFWDWDNKYAVHTPPVELVANLRTALQPIGEVVGICAYGNTHTFAWVPPVERARRELFFSSWSSASGEEELDLRCSVCGAHAATPAKLAAHFRKLHVRQMEKRAAHQPSFRRWRQGNEGKLDRYAVMKHAVQPPKTGYGLKHILRHLGVVVRQVISKPQAADIALKADVSRLLQCIRQQEQSIRTLPAEQPAWPAEDPEEGNWPLEHWLLRADEDSAAQRHAVCVVSNDLGFDRLLRRCQAVGCRTVAVSNQVYTQYRHADVILSWELVQRGLC